MGERASLFAALAMAAMWLTQAGAAKAQSVMVSWIELGPGSSAAARAAGRYGDQPQSLTPTILARSIVSDGMCPKLSLEDGKTIQMALRFSAASLGTLPGSTRQPGFFVDPHAADGAAFADGTAKASPHWAACEAVVPGGHVTASIGGTALKLPVAQPRKILVVGDTGCRNLRQSCTDPVAFPLAYLSTYEAGFSPDLVIHVGDYLYRDKPVLPSGEPWGDDFDGWNADVFRPMKTLLQSAPIVFTRGNHESCGRGARGWYALLDPHPYDAAKVACAPSPPPIAGDAASYSADFEPSYVVHTGGINLLVHDSSFPSDGKLDTALAQNYDRDLTALLTALGPHSMNIFVTHRPSFDIAAGGKTAPGKVHNWGNVTEQAVFSGGTFAGSAFTHGVPSTIGLFLSGHVHQAQYVDLQDNSAYAPQLIVGMSGTALDPDVQTDEVPHGNVDVPVFSEQSAGFTIGHFDGSKSQVLAASAGAHDEFGFALLHARSDTSGQITGFAADIYKLGTTKAGTCEITLAPRKLTCDF